MNSPSTSSQRRYDLDWLRVFAILVVFLFHSTRFFNLGDWHVKSRVTYTSIEITQAVLQSWMMPVIFLISGASIYFAMSKTGSGRYFKDKFLRLGVPLIVGALTHASIQVYLDRLTHYQFFGSYFAFLPSYFQGIYMEGNPSAGNFALFGMHLWYLLVLLGFACLFYPLFAWLKGRGKPVLDKLGEILAFPGALYLLAIPTLLFLDYVEKTPLGDLAPGGWPIPAYLPFFLVGFVLVSNPRLRARIQSSRWISLGIALAFSALFLYWSIQPRYAQLYDDLNGPLYSIMAWGWILAFMGFADRRLGFTNPFLRYANEAVLPFYILHQTVLLVVGYFVLQWQIPDFGKWLVITLASFAIILVIYEYLVRRYNLLRFLFGMKAVTKPAMLKTQASVPAREIVQ